MGRLDVLKSLARSAARSAAARVGGADLREQLQERLGAFPLMRGSVSAAELTKALTRAAGVSAATLRVEADGIAIQVTDERDRDVSLRLIPVGASFAPRGAKEVAFRVDPPELAATPLCAELVGALASAIAHALWGPVLRAGMGANTREHNAFVHRNGPILTADLRTVPEVRAVMGQRLQATLLDALQLQSLETTPGQLKLRLGLHGM